MIGKILPRDLDAPDLYLVLDRPVKGRFYARRWGEQITPEDLAGADTLAELQDALQAAGRLRLTPRPDDPKGILEVWL